MGGIWNGGGRRIHRIERRLKLRCAVWMWILASRHATHNHSLGGMPRANGAPVRWLSRTRLVYRIGDERPFCPWSSDCPGSDGSGRGHGISRVRRDTRPESELQSSWSDWIKWVSKGDVAELHRVDQHISKQKTRGMGQVELELLIVTPIMVKTLDRAILGG